MLAHPADRLTAQHRRQYPLLGPPADELARLPAGQPGDGAPTTQPLRCRLRLPGRVEHLAVPLTGQHGHDTPLVHRSQRLVPPVRRADQLVLHDPPGQPNRTDHIGHRCLRQLGVDPREQPGRIPVSHRRLGPDHHRRARGHQLCGQRWCLPLTGRAGVAGRQGQHRRHAAGRDRLRQELPGVDQPRRPVLVLQHQPARRAVPRQMQHMHITVSQRPPDRTGRRERHDLDLRVTGPGAPHRRQHRPQFPLVVEHPTTAAGRRSDRHHDPQRPRQHPHRRSRRRPPVHRHQPVQRQRHPRQRVRQSLPRQLAEHPGGLHPDPHRHARRLRPAHQCPQLI